MKEQLLKRFEELAANATWREWGIIDDIIGRFSSSYNICELTQENLICVLNEVERMNCGEILEKS